jgi:hypothetical protein
LASVGDETLNVSLLALATNDVHSRTEARAAVLRVQKVGRLVCDGQYPEHLTQSITHGGELAGPYEQVSVATGFPADHADSLGRDVGKSFNLAGTHRDNDHITLTLGSGEDRDLGVSHQMGRQLDMSMHLPGD